MQTKIFFWEKDGLCGLGINSKKNSRVKKMIILLHGYNGDAESNMEFALKLSQASPEAVVFVPDGISPVPPGNDEHHRQWWPLE